MRLRIFLLFSTIINYYSFRYIGGGVLGQGCVQEEIRFVMNPELLVSKLFTECLLPQEALIMVGAEQFNVSTGYASSFEWSGSFEDYTPWDESRRKKCSIVGIDALQFDNVVNKFQLTNLNSFLTFG